MDEDQVTKPAGWWFWALLIAWGVVILLSFCGGLIYLGLGLVK